jgi:hypothetical protein
MPQRIRAEDSQPYLADALGMTGMFGKTKTGGTPKRTARCEFL